jgi:uncharacterized protein DUF6498
MLGFFNFLDMLTVRKVMPSLPPPDGQHSIDELSQNGSTRPGAFFFLFHYGFFHFVYLFFIASMKPSGPFQMQLFKYFLLAFLAGQIITFVQHKIQQRKQATNMGVMLFTPYLRIIPMHLTILLPSFLHIGNMGIFLILKAFADVVMYVVTKPANGDKVPGTAVTAAEQIRNI